MAAWVGPMIAARAVPSSHPFIDNESPGHSLLEILVIKIVPLWLAIPTRTTAVTLGHELRMHVDAAMRMLSLHDRSAKFVQGKATIQVFGNVEDLDPMPLACKWHHEGLS